MRFLCRRHELGLRPSRIPTFAARATSSKEDRAHAEPADDRKLLAMRLNGMVEALKVQEQDRAMHELSFLERVALLWISNGLGARTKRWPGG